MFLSKSRRVGLFLMMLCLLSGCDEFDEEALNNERAVLEETATPLATHRQDSKNTTDQRVVEKIAFDELQDPFFKAVSESEEDDFSDQEYDALIELERLNAEQVLADLRPLILETLSVKYGKASELAAILNQQGQELLSERGSVGVDHRTNTLLIKDTAEQLSAIRDLIKTLDVPVRQVMIDARIVNVRDGFNKDLGVRFGISHTDTLSGRLEGNHGSDEVSDRLNVDLGFDGPSFAVSLAKLPANLLLDLELSALEVEDRAEVIASPRLMTVNQQQAYIEQGDEIAYEEQTAPGGTSVSFKKAALRLEVTPQITPNNKIIMDLRVVQDSISELIVNDVPALATKEIKTQVLVDNGQTLVLGGIYKKNLTRKVSQVPYLGQLPGIGRLFRSESTVSSRDELMIFVTPTIVE